MKKNFVLFLVFWGTYTMGQSLMVPDISYDMVNPLSERSDDPKIIERNMQIMFVEEMFTRPFYSTEAQFKSDDDEEDQFGMYEKQYFNDMMTRKMAEYLVDQDIFQLNKTFSQ